MGPGDELVDQTARQQDPVHLFHLFVAALDRWNGEKLFEPLFQWELENEVACSHCGIVTYETTSLCGIVHGVHPHEIVTDGVRPNLNSLINKSLTGDEEERQCDTCKKTYCCTLHRTYQRRGPLFAINVVWHNSVMNSMDPLQAVNSKAATFSIPSKLSKANSFSRTHLVQNETWQLSGAFCKSGGIDSGHYTTVVIDSDGISWRIDNQHVTRLTSTEDIWRNGEVPVLLFYRNMDQPLPPSPRLLKRKSEFLPEYHA